MTIKSDDVPCQPIMWRVLIEPAPPKEATKGGIILTDDMQQAEGTLTCVGQVLRLGALAFKAKTKAGLDLADEVNAPKAGWWVIFNQYAGQKLWVEDREYRILNDTEILAVTEHPDEFRNYV